MVEWKYIEIDGEQTAYSVDVLGRIYSDISGRYLKPFPNPQGYMLIDIHHNKKYYTRQVHRLVAMAFIPNPDGLETVNHKDGDKSNNAVSNLEWMTRLDNVRHAWRTGLAKARYGIDNPANVYTEEQIHHVCALLELRKLKGAEIARICNVNVALITDIKFRNKWKHISKLYDIPKDRIGYHDIRDKIFACFADGMTNKETMICVGLPESPQMQYQLRRHIEYCRSVYNNRSLND